jgi:hypothetical protein
MSIPDWYEYTNIERHAASGECVNVERVFVNEKKIISPWGDSRDW